jgi:hypothetical protein
VVGLRRSAARLRAGREVFADGPVDHVIQLLDGARADVRHLGPSSEFHGVPTISAGSPALSDTAAASCMRLANGSGVRGDVSHDRGCVGALGVQVGVGIVFGGTPQVVLRIPEQRPPLVLAQETGHPHDVVGRRQVSHAGVFRSGWPECCARLARRGNARPANDTGFLRNWKVPSSGLTKQRDVALQRPATVY